MPAGRHRVHALVLVLGLVGALGCTKSATTTAGAASKTGPTSAVERWFPLEDGKLYHYVTRDGADTGMLVAKVRRLDPAHGELQLSNTAKRFTIGEGGVAYDGGAWILKAPFTTGTTWPGEHGGTTQIAATDVAAEVPAGRYAGCLRTVEDGGRPPGARYESTYCPGIGMVLLVVTAPGTEARAELKSYGMPIVVK